MRALLYIVLAGCFSPQPPAGRPCGEGKVQCPSGLVCSPATNTCEKTAQELDAAIDVAPPMIDAPAPCLADDFNDGEAADWIVTEGAFTIAPTGGPDGSPALRSASSENSGATHASLLGVETARVSANFRVDGATTGDFFVRLYAHEPPWQADPPDGARYTVALYPMGSDDPMDRIYLTLPPALPKSLTSRATTIQAGTWHHVDVVYDGANGGIAATLDGQPYLSIAPTDDIASPLDVAFRLWAPGTIDNVVVECTR